jgi:hypothetical protein
MKRLLFLLGLVTIAEFILPAPLAMTPASAQSRTAPGEELLAYFHKTEAIDVAFIDAQEAYSDLLAAVNRDELKPTGELWAKAVQAVSDKYKSVADRIDTLTNIPPKAAENRKLYTQVASECREICSLLQKLIPTLKLKVLEELSKSQGHINDLLDRSAEQVVAVVDPDGKLNLRKKAAASSQKTAPVPSKPNTAKNSTTNSAISPELIAYSGKLDTMAAKRDKASDAEGRLLRALDKDPYGMSTEAWKNDAVGTSRLYNALADYMESISPVPPQARKIQPLVKRMAEKYRLIATNFLQMSREPDDDGFSRAHSQMKEIVRIYMHVAKEFLEAVNLDKAQRAGQHR